MKKGLWICSVAVLLSACSVCAATTSALVTQVADRLVQTQIINGTEGYWTGDTLFTGTIVAGLIDAYQLTCNSDYKDAAERGARYILSGYEAASCNFYGDQAYALMRLSRIQTNPCSNEYRTRLVDFYECVRSQPGGTEDYVLEFTTGTDASTAVFYLAHHTVAAWYVDAVDKEVWRNYLIHFLAQVEDDAEFINLPVTSLGAAIWALAQTGPLQTDPATPVKIFGSGASYWDGLNLEDLPAVLQSHRAAGPVPYSGNFYWRFDHQYGLGYTEDDVFGILGLSMAQRSFPADYDWDEDIDAARMAMEPAIDAQGKVFAHVDLSKLPPSRPYYAGEMLMALAAAAYPGDIDLDDDVDLDDLGQFAADWLLTVGTSCSYACYKTDLNRDGIVNLHDFALLSGHWLFAR